jgi:hypothetical protein
MRSDGKRTIILRIAAYILLTFPLIHADVVDAESTRGFEFSPLYLLESIGNSQVQNDVLPEILSADGSGRQ